jgi:hypothetical protein
MSARRRTLRVSVAAATLAVAAAPMLLLGAGSSFQADEFCELVSASGPLIDLPPTGHCFTNYGGRTFCETENLDGPPAQIGFEVCVPVPGSSASSSDVGAGSV